jgi:fructokinase
VVCLGEVLVDVAKGGLEFAGGAPANAAFHAAGAGAVTEIISRVGNDARGERLREWLTSAGVGVDALQVDRQVPTGEVRVWETRGADPHYEIVAPAAWDFVTIDEAGRAALRGAAVVVCGTLAQRHPTSRRTIRQLIEEVREAGSLVLADLNLRPPFFDEEIICWTLRQADVLKLSREELRVVSGLLGAQGSDEDLFRGLLREFAIPRGVLTAGAEGAWIWEEGAWSHQPACPVEALSTTGCGDAWVGVMAAALARGGSLHEAAPQASAVAAFVATQPEATPTWPVELSAGRDKL